MGGERRGVGIVAFKNIATSKHLAGAALNSFMAKCKMDTTSRCNQAASDKKLSGAARTSFTKKCIDDGVGATS
jgi:hypothetical protein